MATMAPVALFHQPEPACLVRDYQLYLQRLHSVVRRLTNLWLFFPWLDPFKGLIVISLHFFTLMTSYPEGIAAFKNPAVVYKISPLPS